MHRQSKPQIQRDNLKLLPKMNPPYLHRQIWRSDPGPSVLLSRRSRLDGIHTHRKNFRYVLDVTTEYQTHWHGVAELIELLSINRELIKKKNADAAPRLLDSCCDREEIWHKLPEDVIFSVLRYLPPASLARFRAISRSFHTILKSPAFLGSCAQMRPWLILNVKDSTQHKIFMLESGNGSAKWRDLAFEFLPSSPSRMVAASGGLVCIQGENGALFVCNPCTKGWIRLPSLTFGEYDYPVIGMIKAEDSQSYKVVVTGLKHTTEVYDSSTRSWKVIVGGKPSHDSCTIFYEGFLFSAGIAEVLTYNVAKEAWSEIDYPVPWPRLCAKRMSQCGGKLFLVANDSEDHVLSVWTLGDLTNGRNCWSKLHALSLNHVHKLPEVDKSLMDYGQYKDNFVFYAGFRKLMAFSLVEMAWYQFSRYPKDYPFNFFYKHTIFQLQPTLETVAM